MLIQRIYTHFKKAPATHKLGVLYVVDSVTRGWVEQARRAGQTFGPSATDGTFAAGVNRVTELLPSFMSDIIANAPEEQKVRLLEIRLKHQIHELARNVGYMIALPKDTHSIRIMYKPDLRMFLCIRLGFLSSLISGNVELHFLLQCFLASRRS